MLNTQSIVHWVQHRDAQYMAQRAGSLLKRYGITPNQAQRRILQGMDLLARYDCAPTFPTPGRVVDAHPEFCRTVQSMGAELAVHGYDHVDFRSLSIDSARGQFAAAVEAFRAAHIEVAGFRCPYLSYDRSLSSSLPCNAFSYSSNKAFWWSVPAPEGVGEGNALYRTLQGFYRADSADSAVVTPRLQEGVVEIPASIPDDLQLHDGLKLGPDGLTKTWKEILDRAYRRGELFALLFHPESFLECSDAFESILSTAVALHPRVWISRLKDVSEWWHEKASFGVETQKAEDGFRLRFECSPRATVLVRGLRVVGSKPWSGDYQLVEDRSPFVPGPKRPFIGVPINTSPAIIHFLREQGFIVETNQLANDCSLYLSPVRLNALQSERELIDFVEADPAPLVRFWRWPSGAKSALCITGDLDALCLVDYVRRLLPPPRFVN
jgi:peptidoglycan/xylan/chitin deacetylase (PgdA/CDA1 family)